VDAIRADGGWPIASGVVSRDTVRQRKWSPPKKRLSCAQAPDRPASAALGVFARMDAASVTANGRTFEARVVNVVRKANTLGEISFVDMGRI
jgi:hypothetical protein